MLKYWALIRVSFRGLLNNFSFGSGTGKKKKRAATGIGAMVLMGALSVYISVVYSIMLGSMLAPAGMLAVMPIIMAVVAVLMSTMFTVLAASGIVFGSKDMDLILALPISAFSVMLSKILALYLENLLFGVFIMLPSGAAYLYFGGQGGVLFVIRLLLATIFLPLLPTMLTLLIGFAIAWVTGHLRRKALLANIAYFFFFGLTMLFIFKINAVLPTLLTKGESMNNAFSTWLYPFGVFGDAIYGNGFALLLFILITTLPFLILVYLFSVKYKKILTILSSHATRTDYKMEALKVTGCFAALFKKEASRFFGTPIYLFNAGFGVVMAVGGCVFAVIKKADISALMLQMGDATPVLPLLAVMLCFIYVMTYPCCVSISLEGKTLWILKAAPIPTQTLFRAKAWLNILLIWGTGLVCVPMLWYAFELTLVQVLSLLALTCAMGIYVAFACLIINLFFPKMDAENEALVVKQSTSALLGMFINLLIPALGVGGYFLIGNKVDFSVFLFVASAALLIVDYMLWKFLKIKGSRMLLEI